MSEAYVYAFLFLVVAVLGIRGSWRLTSRYRAIKSQLIARERWILLAIVIVAWAVTFAALYFGGLTMRRLVGFEALPQLAPASALIATGILLIPAFLDWVVEQVARVPWK